MCIAGIVPPLDARFSIRLDVILIDRFTAID